MLTCEKNDLITAILGQDIFFVYKNLTGKWLKKESYKIILLFHKELNLLILKKISTKLKQGERKKSFFFIKSNFQLNQEYKNPCLSFSKII